MPRNPPVTGPAHPARGGPTPLAERALTTSQGTWRRQESTPTTHPEQDRLEVQAPEDLSASSRVDLIAHDPQPGSAHTARGRGATGGGSGALHVGRALVQYAQPQASGSPPSRSKPAPQRDSGRSRCYVGATATPGRQPHPGTTDTHHERMCMQVQCVTLAP